MSPSALRFEELVRLILEANDFSISRDPTEIPDAGFDFKARWLNDVWAVEVKFYRTARAQVSLLNSAASRLASRGVSAGVEKGLLIVSCQLSPALKTALEEKFSVTFVDRADLTMWATKTPSLVDELNSLFESDADVFLERTGNPAERTQHSKPLARLVSEEDKQGTYLCQELAALDRGRGNWSKYEQLCDRILRYLFPIDLHGWHKQRRTDDGLNRFDYVCRMQPATEFWRFLIQHLDSRYVLFEFKNYRAKIKQGQILTTEKYLLERGLRKVAIIICRVGADADAVKMTQGAMREHGKLMLIVDDNQVCQMLHMKERGEDPTDHLFELADKFLLSLPR